MQKSKVANNGIESEFIKKRNKISIQNKARKHPKKEDKIPIQTNPNEKSEELMKISCNIATKTPKWLCQNQITINIRQNQARGRHLARQIEFEKRAHPNVTAL